MGDKTKIEWCDATINPIIGCTKVSPGCAHCYAERQAKRLVNMGRGRYETTIRAGKWSGLTNFVPSELEKMERWTKPRRIFVGSMGDVFHGSVLKEWIGEILTRCHRAAIKRGHTFIFLTKRPETMDVYIWDWLYDNRLTSTPAHFWLGVSAEDQPRLDERAAILIDIPAAVRIVSIEPMLGPVNVDWPVDWAIVGGESGPKARPLNPDWVRAVRDQCEAGGVPFFFKQWGEWVLEERDDEIERWARVGKKRAGCVLDHKTHKAFPAP